MACFYEDNKSQKECRERKVTSMYLSYNSRMGADMGHTTNYLFHLHLYETLLKFGYIDEDCRELPCGIETMVHDSIREEVPYHLFVINAYILQWVATIGISEYYRDVFNVDMLIPPEIDMETGSNDAYLFKWDWARGDKAANSLENVVRMSLLDQQKAGKCDDVDQAFKEIFNIPKEVEQYLIDMYPVVGNFVPPTKVRPYHLRANFMINETKE